MAEHASPDALRSRHRVMQAIRTHFDARDFVEVETPAIVPSPGLDVHLDALEVVGAGAPRYLHTSPEYQMKRLLGRGLDRIYQLGKAFRRGERGRFHNPEFTMLEWYAPGADCDELMRQTEALVAEVADRVLGQQQVPGLTGPVDVSVGWERLTVRDAFRRYAGLDMDAVLPDEDRYFRVLIEAIEPNLGKGRPTFLYRYPASMASLARLCDDDPSVAERVESYLDGVELSNGFAELTDPAEQRARLQADQSARKSLGKPVYPIDERFLTDLASVQPSVGNALGVDRLVLLVLGAHAIDDVLSFTHDSV